MLRVLASFALVVALTPAPLALADENAPTRLEPLAPMALVRTMRDASLYQGRGASGVVTCLVRHVDGRRTCTSRHVPSRPVATLLIATGSVVSAFGLIFTLTHVAASSSACVEGKCDLSVDRTRTLAITTDLVGLGLLIPGIALRVRHENAIDDLAASTYAIRPLLRVGAATAEVGIALSGSF